MMELPSNRQIEQMRMEELDRWAVELAGRKFAPVMSLSARRKRLIAMMTNRRILDGTSKVRTFKLNLRPRSTPKQLPHDAVLERTLFYAAHGMPLPLGDLVNIAEAHLLGVGEFSEDITEDTVAAIKSIHTIYGWGVRHMADGCLEFYA